MTFSPTALKMYSQCRSVRSESLAWLRITNRNGESCKQFTISSLHSEECLDYLDIDFYTITTHASHSPLSQATPVTPPHTPPLPILRNSFVPQPLDILLIHRRLGHPSISKMEFMCKHKLMDGLPARLSTEDKNKIRQCWICCRAKLHAYPRGPTQTSTIIPFGLFEFDCTLYVPTYECAAFTVYSFVAISDKQTCYQCLSP